MWPILANMAWKTRLDDSELGAVDTWRAWERAAYNLQWWRSIYTWTAEGETVRRSLSVLIVALTFTSVHTGMSTEKARNWGSNHAESEKALLYTPLPALALQTGGTVNAPYKRLNITLTSWPSIHRRLDVRQTLADKSCPVSGSWILITAPAGAWKLAACVEAGYKMRLGEEVQGMMAGLVWSAQPLGQGEPEIDSPQPWQISPDQFQISSDQLRSDWLSATFAWKTHNVLPTKSNQK